MQAANRLQTALKKGASFGAWHMLPGTNLARQMASTGLDWILVDCEHGNIADAQMHESVTAIAAMSVSPIVRIPSTEPWMIKRALDAGAHGVMVPLLETAAQARDIVKAAKFPPLGRRGFGSPFPQAAFKGVDTGVQYLQEANEGLVTVMQIETKEALANVEEIARVDGVDVLFVGPFDLGNNIGHPYIGTMHDNLRDAIAKIHKAAHDAGKKSGIYCTSGTQAREYADMGFEMINITGDVLALQNYIGDQLQAAKGSYAHSALQMAKGAAREIEASRTQKLYTAPAEAAYLEKKNNDMKAGDTKDPKLTTLITNTSHANNDTNQSNFRLTLVGFLLIVMTIVASLHSWSVSSTSSYSKKQKDIVEATHVVTPSSNFEEQKRTTTVIPTVTELQFEKQRRTNDNDIDDVHDNDSDADRDFDNGPDADSDGVAHKEGDIDIYSNGVRQGGPNNGGEESRIDNVALAPLSGLAQLHCQTGD